MFSWQEQRPNARFDVAEDPLVRLRFLGVDSAGDPVLSVRSTELIDSTGLFPTGRVLSLMPKKNAPHVLVEVKAFEYGYYSDMAKFESRQLHARRAKGAHVGILTCAYGATI